MGGSGLPQLGFPRRRPTGWMNGFTMPQMILRPAARMCQVAFAASAGVNTLAASLNSALSHKLETFSAGIFPSAGRQPRV